MKCSLDWQTWERLSKLNGDFYYDTSILMRHRIHEEPETSHLIADNTRSVEDLEMMCKFWPRPIAKIINHFYAKSQQLFRIDAVSCRSVYESLSIPRKVALAVIMRDKRIELCGAAAMRSTVQHGKLIKLTAHYSRAEASTAVPPTCGAAWLTIAPCPDGLPIGRLRTAMSPCPG